MKLEEKKFKKLFGAYPNEFADVLIISPFFNVKLFSQALKEKVFFKGMLFKGVSGLYKDKKITFVNTGMGQTFVVDCVLAQDSRKIKKIIFLGAVGAIQDLEIADNVVIKEAVFDTEYHKKFGINFKDDLKTFKPDLDLYEYSMFLAEKNNYNLKQANVISIHTFWDQGIQRARNLADQGMQSVDLECALFYAATGKKKIRSIAFCFVSDNIISCPFWGDFSPKLRSDMKNRVSDLVVLALELGQERCF